MADADAAITPAMHRRGAITIRVRYQECDPMGVAHHTVYPVWFEMGRTELLRGTGTTYRDLEEAGVLLAVTSLEVTYRRPARYDDELALLTEVERITRAKVIHQYELRRDSELLATGRSTIACLDRTGRPQPLPAIVTGAR